MMFIFLWTGGKGSVSCGDEEQRISIPGVAWLLQFEQENR